MNLRYRQSEPHPDSDAAHLGSSPHSCVGIVRRWVPREHIAEGFAVGDCNADADGITIRVNHRRQMAGGVLPVCHSLLRNPFWVHDSERCQVGAEAVRIPGCCHSLTFRLVIMAGVQVGGAFLRRIHEAYPELQARPHAMMERLHDAQKEFKAANRRFKALVREAAQAQKKQVGQKLEDSKRLEEAREALRAAKSKLHAMQQKFSRHEDEV